MPKSTKNNEFLNITNTARYDILKELYANKKEWEGFFRPPDFSKKGKILQKSLAGIPAKIEVHVPKKLLIMSIDSKIWNGYFENLKQNKPADFINKVDNLRRWIENNQGIDNVSTSGTRYIVWHYDKPLGSTMNFDKYVHLKVKRRYGTNDLQIFYTNEHVDGKVIEWLSAVSENDNAQLLINFATDSNLHSIFVKYSNIYIKKIIKIEKIDPPTEEDVSKTPPAEFVNIKNKFPKITDVPESNMPDFFQIGVVKLLIPPQLIQVNRESHIKEEQKLRSRGTNIINAGYEDVVVNLTLFFANPEGITQNLVPLIVHFRNTPFVPVINNYLNYSHNIDAAALVDLSVTTVQNYPHILSAKLTFFKFDWRAYMPGINSNVWEFAETVNWSILKKYIAEKSAEINAKIKGMEFSDGTAFSIIWTPAVQDAKHKRHQAVKDYINKINEIVGREA